ncbi:TonB-dependent Receptor Plug Domain [Granulicella rosea]|uniref:TonB-dependent Receptor Plug Domain n=1 Tax=Granulicella rosea TaxID=474952 RepID=A0A239JXK8_9BACT|nr:carboxypeptidase regulatory-like domain-containing protein [Granulicella rosea]SNT10153.1 TonB-dependent Receptor Plug Domain [Granulicella rosea]
MSKKHMLSASALALFAVSASAQVATDAVITGTVTDSTQRAMDGATITVRDVSTGVTVTSKTNSQGQYRTPPLKIGEYTVEIQSAGFRHSIENGVHLDIGAIRQINAVLTPGDVSEVVEVKATTEELLQRSDSTVGTVITTQQIEELPLNGGSNGRDYLQLGTLSAGTTPGNSSGGISIGGQASAQAAFLLDGIDNNNQQILTSHDGQKEVIKPSVDAISEFKVVTTSYSAEYGRSSSGVVSVNTKSGTNAIHGSAYEFIRNDAVDALPDFTQGKPPFKYNDFGGTVGGPIRKDRTFVFGDVEFFRLRSAVTTYALVPTDAQKSGQFSSAIYDPAGGYTISGTTVTRSTQFSGNQIPSGRIDPIASNVLKYYPEPNGSFGANNYYYNKNTGTNNYRWDARIDEILTGKQSIFGRYSSEQNAGAISALPALNGQYFSGSGAQTVDAQAFVVGYNVQFSPNILGNIRAGWNSIKWVNNFPNQSLTGVGVPGVAATAPGFTEITVTNFQTIGTSNVPNADDSENREVAAAILWTKGAHTLQFGWQEYWLQTNFNSSQLTSGIFDFNGQYTAKSPTATPSNDQHFADLLLGLTDKKQLSSPSIINFRSPYSHFYVQDDWKASHSLTLNLGVRYELSPPAVSKFNSIANFDEDSDPSNPQLIYAGEYGNSRAQRALQNVNYTNVAPRVGFAFSRPNSKTVLRGGYGIFYSNAITIGGMQSMENNPPVNQLRLATSPSSYIPTQFQYLQNGFAAGALSLTNANGATGVSLVSFDRHAAIPIDQSWNLNVQRALPYGIVAEVGYYGNKFDHNWWQVDGNPAPATPTTLLPAAGINANRLYKTTTIPNVPGNPTIGLGTVSRVWKEGWSQYNALQAKAEKRYARGVTFIASYAYSKTLGVGDVADFQDPTNIRAERAVMNTDMRHHFVGSAVYPLPFGHGQLVGDSWNRWLDGAFGGWSISPILTASSGQPLNLTESKNPSNSGGTADRPNIVGDPRAKVNASGTPTATPNQWFNTSAFAVQASGTYGNAPRNAIVGPGILNLDAGIHKTLAIRERFQAQLRLESFNVTNSPHYGTPGLNVQSPTTLGVITTVTGNPRQNQLAIKLLF